MSTASFRLVRIARRGSDAAFAAGDWETFLGHQNTVIEFSRDPDEVVAAVATDEFGVGEETVSVPSEA